mmetsp:Transcript_21549/g.46870  ORF Transcript_21549/g.46870 Transcript_21549/m.46870 type:complete len:624 (+) Transcript_21549:183-2054(+)
MHSFRRKNKSQWNGSRKISQLNGHKKQIPLSPALLVRKCSEHPKLAKALFVSILISWVGLVALFISNLPSIKHASAALSPLSARDKHNQPQQRRTLSPDHANAAISTVSATAAPIIKRQVKKPPPMRKGQDGRESIHQSARDRITSALLAKLPGSHMPPHPKPKDNRAKQLRAQTGVRQMRRAAEKPLPTKKKQNKTESAQQSTQDALESSKPYVQKSADMSSYDVQKLYAFAAENYLDKKTMMGEDDDSLDTYFAVDDDAVRGKDYTFPEGRQGFCSTPSFYRLYRPNCNELHSTVSTSQWLTGEEYMRKHHQSRYLASGAFRQVFLLERQFPSNSDEVVFKTMKRFSSGNGRTFEERAAYDPEEVKKNFDLYDDMRKDSMVMEQLTSSPRIADIYSFCALSSIIEYAPGNIEKSVMPTGGEKEDDDDPAPVNQIAPLRKLEMALELAKGIATMHGHSDGVIANVDVQIGQFCRGKDGLIKVLDFNRAEVMMYDEDRDEYCKFENGSPPDGSQRAPEEIIDAPLTEKIDVYSLGNVFYTILTGLLVNRKYNTPKAHWRITHGKTEEFDVDYFVSRSPAEMALVEVIQWCWTFKVEERPSVFQIVEYLEDEIKKNISSENTAQ